MFSKILIANRGEIACRIIKTARRLGILTVAVYSDADRQARHVAMADEAICIGPAPSRESYLNINKVIAAACTTGAEAIHPGYGFLSENADFCKTCKANNIVFIGPPTGAIEAMGSKAAAKNIMHGAGVPLVPGYHGDDQDPAVLKKAADKIGYPVLLKATAGGGGKGMRQVWNADEFDEALAAARREALNGFDDERMLVEKYLTQPRHVEIQVFCDQQGNAVYLAERDCSVQRRHQKVIEEAPAPGMTEKLRQEMGEAAIRSALAIDYQGAGTVEFLLDVDGSFYFMEMNTRLQVEHPVTEMITGQDLVEWQLRVASGEPLPLKQDQITLHGHAFEARVYAEDPGNDFLPATGTLAFLQPPVESANVRVDTGVLQGDQVSVYYDPMIAKLVVWDEDRDRALQRLCKALREYRIGGLTTNLEFLYKLASCKPFKAAELDTAFIEKHHALIFDEKESVEPLNAEQLGLAALYILLRRAEQTIASTQTSDTFSPWNQSNNWRLNETHRQTLEISCRNQTYSVVVEQQCQTAHDAMRTNYAMSINGKMLSTQGQLHDNKLLAEIDNHQRQVSVSEHKLADGQLVYTLYAQHNSQHGALEFTLASPELGDHGSNDNNSLTAPMNGTIVSLLVEPQQSVSQGEGLLIMEAMKMEHTLRAPCAGTVETFYYQAGDLVDGGAELLDFSATTSETKATEP